MSDELVLIAIFGIITNLLTHQTRARARARESLTHSISKLVQIWRKGRWRTWNAFQRNYIFVLQGIGGRAVEDVCVCMCVECEPLNTN